MKYERAPKYVSSGPEPAAAPSQDKRRDCSLGNVVSCGRLKQKLAKISPVAEKSSSIGQ